MKTTTLPTDNMSSAAPPPPMNMLRRLLWRLRSRGEDSLELGVIEHQVARETAELQTATTESETIERQWAAARAMERDFLTDAKTPGVIDAREARQLAAALTLGAVQTREHTTHLRALAS